VSPEVSRLRPAAAGTLPKLAAEGLLHARHGQILGDALLGGIRDRDMYEVSCLVAPLGYLSSPGLPKRLLNLLTEWATEGADWLSWRSLEVLARRGMLLSIPDPIRRRLHLEMRRDGWHMERSGMDDQAAFIVGLLYILDRRTFEPAIAEVIEHEDWSGALQVLSCLMRVHGATGMVRLPRSIRRALTQRLTTRSSATGVEVELVHYMAVLAPSELIQSRWAEVWSSWTPEARAAWADAIRGAGLRTRRSLRNAARSLLVELARDGHFMVRRSAYRALAAVAPRALGELSMAWSYSESPDLRQRAAEAVQWSRNLPRAVLRQVLSDPEAHVRKAARDALDEQRRREWSNEYTSQVLHGGTSSDGILRSWRYGRALASLGDDDSIALLRERIPARELFPNQRWWIGQIESQLEKQWSERVRAWPGPWRSWRGAFEECDGKILLGDGNSLAVHFSLWRQPGVGIGSRADWGGHAVGDVTPIFGAIEDGRLTLRLSDGRTGEALPSQVTNGIVVLRGNGPYPKSSGPDA
jgi:hypothetical protein